MDGATAGHLHARAPEASASRTARSICKGQAEDHFRVLVSTRRARCRTRPRSDALLTKEWTPLEPGVLDHKFYVRGVGTVLEQTVKGGQERNELVSYDPG